MDRFAAAMAHNDIEEVFPGVFFVSGSFQGEFFGSMWHFSRNMTIVREGDALTLINSVRLNENGLKALDALGKVTNVVKIGSMHGIDDPFYVDRYGATYWAMAGMPLGEGLKVDKELRVGGEMPFSGCEMFAFETTKLPECILRLNREGGIMIACDALQNWVGPDALITPDTVEKMQGMGFFQRANLGPAWMHVNEPKAADFERLKKVSFKHALCGHGVPLRDTAQGDFHATFKRIFGI